MGVGGGGRGVGGVSSSRNPLLRKFAHTVND